MIKIALLLVITAAVTQAYPSYGYGGYGGYGGGYGYAHGSAAPSLNEYAVNKYQAHRQQAVNNRAEAVGASSGTARYEGVPGTSESRFAGNYGYAGY